MSSSGLPSACLWATAPPGDLNYPDSDADASIASDSDNEDDDPFALPLEEHRAQHRAILRQSSPNYNITACGTSQHPDRRLIIEPSASKLQYTISDPIIYRELRPSGSLSDFAIKLGLTDGDIRRFHDIGSNIPVYNALANMSACHNSEKALEGQLHTLLALIATYYDLGCVMFPGVKYAVGGLLADDNLAVFGITDNCFRSHIDSSRYIIATEAKTRRSFRLNRLWYKNSRSLQALSAFRSTTAPVLLYTQEQFKIIFEFQGYLYTFPAGFDTGTVLTIEFLFCLAYVLQAGNNVDPPPRPKQPVFATPTRTKGRPQREQPSAELPSKKVRTRPMNLRQIEMKNYSGLRVDALWSTACPDDIDCSSSQSE